MGLGIDPAGMDVAQENQHQEPELGPLMGALGFQGHDGAAGIVGRRGGAMFSSQIACKPVEVACGHPHGGKHGRPG